MRSLWFLMARAGGLRKYRPSPPTSVVKSETGLPTPQLVGGFCPTANAGPAEAVVSAIAADTAKTHMPRFTGAPPYALAVPADRSVPHSKRAAANPRRVRGFAGGSSMPAWTRTAQRAHNRARGKRGT